MMQKNKELIEGVIARHIESTYVKYKNYNNMYASDKSFSLRDLKNKLEKYVSFSLVTEDVISIEEQACIGLTQIKLKRKVADDDAISVFDIKLCLEMINDEEESFIEFREQNLPHCGLHYLTTNTEKLNEIKLILSEISEDKTFKVGDLKQADPPTPEPMIKS